MKFSLISLLVLAFLQTVAAAGNWGPSTQVTGVSGSRFGSSAAISDDENFLFVGAYASDSVWIWNRASNGSWVLFQEITSSNLSFGFSLSITPNGSTLVVGSPFSSSSFVYEKVGLTYNSTAELIGSNILGSSRQGTSVSISADGNTIAVGDSNDADQLGATWVFVRTSNGSWSEQAKLVGECTPPCFQGISVSLSNDGNMLAVGGPLANNYDGAVWVYTRTSGTWNGVKLPAISPGTQASVGAAVALSGDGSILAVGAPGENSNTGSTRLFANAGGGTWNLTATLLANNSDVNFFQGENIALSRNGNVVAVGSTTFDGYRGGTWVFVRDPVSGVYQQEKPTLQFNVPENSEQGREVALTSDGSLLVVSAPQYDSVWITRVCSSNCVTCPTKNCTECNTNNYLSIQATCQRCSTCNSGFYLTSPCGNTTDTICNACTTCGAESFESSACNATHNTVCTSCTTCGAGNYTSVACGATTDAMCSVCTTCGTGSFESSACNATHNTVCTSCTTCGIGTYASVACGVTTDTVCSTCATCGEGSFQSSACNATHNTVCPSCTTCGTGTYSSVACGANTDTVCSSCTTCGTETFASSACNATHNTVCSSCTTCGARSYQSSACNATHNTVCQSCTTCGTGTYASVACGATSDTLCSGCATCGIGAFESSACNATHNTICSSCTTCGIGNYSSVACGVTTDTVCSACTTCGEGSFQSSACNATHNTVCQSCTTCGTGNYSSVACGATSDTVCLACAICGDGSFQSSACNATHNTVCASCTTCGTGTYAAVACGATADTVCSGCATCADGSFESSACNATHNTVCPSCTTCGIGTYASVACGATTDTQCSACATCNSGFFQSQACNSTHDTVCSECTNCNSGSFAESACDGTSDTVCTACQTCNAGYFESHACNATHDTVCSEIVIPIIVSGCPASPQVLTAISAGPFAFATWAAPTAATRLGAPLAINSTTNLLVIPPDNLPAVAFSQQQPILVQYKFVDENDNVDFCNVSVYVQDVTPVTISGCPSPFTVPNDANKLGASVVYPPITVTDNVMPIFYISVSQPYLNLVNGSFFPMGVHTIILIWVDPSRTPVNCTFRFTVIDDNACAKGVNGGCHQHATCRDKVAPAPGTPNAAGRDCVCKPGFFGNGIQCSTAIPQGTILLNLTVNQSLSSFNSALFSVRLANVSGAVPSQIHVVDANAIDPNTITVLVSISALPNAMSPADIVTAIINAQGAELTEVTGYEQAPSPINNDDTNSSGLSDKDKAGLALGLVSLGCLLLVAAYWVVTKSKKEGN